MPNIEPWRRVFFFIVQKLCWLVANCLFNLKVFGKENLSQDRACLIASNHVSFVDWLLITSGSARPIVFTMYVGYFSRWLRWFFKAVQVIPICSKTINLEIYSQAFKLIDDHLKNNRIVCMFPEGTITSTGTMNHFKYGINKVLRTNPVDVIPTYISYSLWGHWSTRSKERTPFWKRPNVNLVFGKKMQAKFVTIESLEEKIRNL